MAADIAQGDCVRRRQSNNSSLPLAELSPVGVSEPAQTHSSRNDALYSLLAEEGAPRCAA